MGGTYGGNAVACAAAIATLDVFEEEGVLDNVRNRRARACSMAWRLTEVSLATQVRKQGARATSTLNTLKAECPAVVDVRGPGLMLGVEFDRSLTGFAGEVSRECEANGLLEQGAVVERPRARAVLIRDLSVRLDQQQPVAMWQHQVRPSPSGARSG